MLAYISTFNSTLDALDRHDVSMSWDTISSPLLSRKAKWRCAKSRSLPLLEATSKLRKLHADTLLVEACASEPTL